LLPVKHLIRLHWPDKFSLGTCGHLNGRMFHPSKWRGKVGHPIPTDASGSPTRWLIVFDRRAATWWASLVALGRHKHARCFGYIHACDAWLFYDCQFFHTTIQVARGEEAKRLIAEWTADADVLAMNAGTSGRFWPGLFRPMLCTTAVARLLGLPCRALRPDAFRRQCLRHGATIVQIARVRHGATDHYDQRSGTRKEVL
jgi:hypothetical protein